MPLTKNQGLKKTDWTHRQNDEAAHKHQDGVFSQPGSWKTMRMVPRFGGADSLPSRMRVGGKKRTNIFWNHRRNFSLNTKKAKKNMQLLGKLPTCSGFVHQFFFEYSRKCLANLAVMSLNVLPISYVVPQPPPGRWMVEFGAPCWGSWKVTSLNYNSWQHLPLNSQPSLLWSQSLWARFSGHWIPLSYSVWSAIQSPLKKLPT